MADHLTSQLSKVEHLQDLYPLLHARSVMPGWAKPTASLYREPLRNFHPAHWQWSEGRAALDSAGRLISAELAHRRNLLLFNPLEGNTYATLRTMVAAYQMILPGEKAPSHRHSGNALRVVLEGEGAYTIVEGERLNMRPNDVILTPDWKWHGHGSDGDTPCYWMDGLDTPLVHLLEPMFLEDHPDGLQRTAITPNRSPYVFAWEQVQAELDRTAEDPSGRYGRRIELGAPAMVTLALYMQRHATGALTRRFRTTANQIFVVIEGEGTTSIDDETFAWSRGDVIAVPAWRPFTHSIAADATLFSMTDEPALRAFQWLRTADA
jgi:gentisate 1,2-dioxygenase